MKIDQNFTLMAGDYQQVLIDPVYDDDGELYPGLETGLLSWCLYTPPDYDNPIITKHSSSGQITVPSTGHVLIVIEGGNTEGLEAGKYYHKLTWTKNGKKKTVSTGVVTMYNEGSEYFRS